MMLACILLYIRQLSKLLVAWNTRAEPIFSDLRKLDKQHTANHAQLLLGLGPKFQLRSREVKNNVRRTRM